MKKIISVISVFAILCTLTGCSRFARVAGDMKWKFKASQIANEQAEIILNCFKTGDSEELEALFCKNVSSSHNLKAEIAKAIEFIDGNIVDDGKWIGMGSGGEAVDNGITTKLDIHPSLHNVKTDTGKECLIIFNTYLIYEEDTNNVGMTFITIKGENESIIIGEVVT